MIVQIHDFLHEQHPFVLLGKAELDRITATVDTRTFAAGATILQRGGPISPGTALSVSAGRSSSA